MSRWGKKVAGMLPRNRPSKREILVLCMPMYAKPNPKTMNKFFQLVAHWHQLGNGIDVVIFMPTATVITYARNQAIERALEFKDRLVGVCFIDDDMDFPVGVGALNDGSMGVGINPVERLVRREKDVIGYLCTGRAVPLRIAFGYWQEDGTPINATDPALVALTNDTPFQVPWVGMAFTFISGHAIRTMHEKLGTTHLFNHDSNWRWNARTDGVLKRILSTAAMGRDIDKLTEELKDDVSLLIRQSDQTHEDTGFCRKATDCGLGVWCDPTVGLAHIGDYPYTRMDWLAQRQIHDEAEAKKGQAELASA